VGLSAFCSPDRKRRFGAERNQDRRDQLLLVAAGLHRALSQGLAAAVEEINAAGGINGKKLVVVSKDDSGKPADAQTAANELVSSENVAMLTGTFLSNIGLAVSDFANQKRSSSSRPSADRCHYLVEGQPLHLPSAPFQLHAGGDAGGRAAKLPAKRWATIAPNYEYGQSAWRCSRS